MADNNATANSKDGAYDTQSILLIVNVVLTFITTIMTGMRFRAKCGNAMLSCKPKDTKPSPGSEASAELYRVADSSKTGDGRDPIPENTIAIIIDDGSGGFGDKKIH